jgi:hypothetical protein
MMKEADYFVIGHSKFVIPWWVIGHSSFSHVGLAPYNTPFDFMPQAALNY